MDKTLFTERLKPLGHFQKRFKDEFDEVFVTNPTTSLCPHCDHGWELTIEKKFGYKQRAYWRYKCRACKLTWT